MKRIFLQVTASSVLALAIYMILYPFWGGVVEGLKDYEILALSITASIATISFSVVLFLLSKIRKGVEENEVIEDYKNCSYDFWSDCKTVFLREWKLLLTITGIISACFLLNLVDRLIFGKKTFSAITVLFAPTYMFDMVIPIPFLGYLLNAFLICLIYLLLVLFHRKKVYRYWNQNGEGRQ